MSFFANRIVFITGAGSGIGRQLALTLSARGAKIAAVDLTPEPLAALEKDLNGKPFAWTVADVTDRPRLIQAAAELEGKLGPIDMLIANAGIGRETDPLDFKAEVFEEVIRVNLLGVANSVEAVLPGMLQRKRGHLVGIASLASYRGLPRMGAYCASKAGVTALFDSLRYELQPLGLDVTTICPGWIRTALTKDIEVPHHFMLSVEEAVNRMVWAIEKKKLWYTFPWSATRRVRLLRWLPCSISDWLLRQMVPVRSPKPQQPAST